MGETMNSSFLLQLVKGDTHGQQGAGDRRVMAGFQGGWVDADEWANFRPTGMNVDAWNAMTKTHRVWSGTVEYDFNDLVFIAPMIFGAAVSSNPSGGVTTDTYELPDFGERDTIQPFSVEYGQRDNCEKCHYGLVMSFTGGADRDGQHVSGQITILCQQPDEANIDVPMTGWEAANQKYEITLAAGGYGVATLDIQDADGVSIDTIEVEDGEANSAVKSDIEGLDGITTVTVTGSVPAATYSGDAVTGGTATAGETAGSDVASNARDGNTSTQWRSNDEAAWWQMDWGSGNAKVIKAMRIFCPADPDDAAMPADFTVEASNTGAFSGEEVELHAETGFVPTPNAYNNFLWDNDTAYRYYRIVITGANGAGYVVLREVQFYEEVASSGGTFVVTFTDPDETRFRIVLDSQTESGWSVSETQRASVGEDVSVPLKQPVLVDMQSHRIATALSGLAGASAIDKAKGSTMNLGNLVEPVWFADEGNLTYQSHVDGGDRQQEFSLTLAETSTQTETLKGLSLERPAGERAFEHRFVHPDDEYALKIQHYSSIRGAIGYGAAGNVRTREFPLGPVSHSADNAVKFIISYPTPA